MSKQRIHRSRSQTSVQASRERETRLKFQAQRPALAELVASGECSQPISQGEYVELMRTAARLKKLRERAGLSLAEMAQRTGMDRSAISRLENGIVTNPTLATLDRYARALGKRIRIQLVSADGGG